ADAAVAGQKDGASLIATADQLEEEVCRVRFQGQIAEFIDDQQLGLDQVGELVLEPTVCMPLSQACRKGGRRHELDRIAGADGFSPECDGEMSLSDAGRSEQQHVLAVGNPTPGGEITDL